MFDMCHRPAPYLTQDSFINHGNQFGHLEERKKNLFERSCNKNFCPFNSKPSRLLFINRLLA